MKIILNKGKLTLIPEHLTETNGLFKYIRDPLAQVDRNNNPLPPFKSDTYARHFANYRASQRWKK
jgi:hypothetical protein